jgi:pyridoxine/pyridoxamine 5'-phosphate oxidase
MNDFDTKMVMELHEEIKDYYHEEKQLKELIEEFREWVNEETSRDKDIEALKLATPDDPEDDEGEASFIPLGRMMGLKEARDKFIEIMNKFTDITQAKYRRWELEGDDK